eukprot:1008784-Prymnesium_polylepis.1
MAAREAPILQGPVRALVILEVEPSGLFHFGPTRIAAVDPHGALAARHGAALVEDLRHALRQSGFPTLGQVCGTISSLIFNEPTFYLQTFEALVVPVGGSGPKWDASLLGRHRKLRHWHDRQETLAISPDLACCAVRTCEDTQAAGFRVPIMMLQPFVPRDMPDGAAAEEVRRQMRQGKHKAYNSKRGQIADGEIEEGSPPGAAGVSKKRKHQSSPKGSNKAIAVGRLVLLKAYLDDPSPEGTMGHIHDCLLYTSPSPRDAHES